MDSVEIIVTLQLILINNQRDDTMKYSTYLITLIFSVSMLSACGWHLRGSGESVSIQQAIYLEGKSGNVYSALNNTLERRELLKPLTQADIQLVILDERFERRTVAQDNQAQTTQYQLTLSVDYEILDTQSLPLTSVSTAEITRYFTFDQNAVTSADKEEQSLRKEMVQQVTQQILQRVIFLSKQTNP